MPNIKSAKKRVLVNNSKAARNKSAKSALKTSIKKANAASEEESADKEAAVKAAVAKIDRAAAKGLIHKNNAAHKKSALQLKLNKKTDA
jgi:small subunit ribosomal protein S20